MLLYSMNGHDVVIHGSGGERLSYAALQEELDKATLRAISYPDLPGFGFRMVQLREALAYMRAHLTVGEVDAQRPARWADGVMVYA